MFHVEHLGVVNSNAKDFSKKYRGKTFVDDVEYEVKEESAEDKNNQ